MAAPKTRTKKTRVTAVKNAVKQDPEVFTYLTMRKLVGILGIALPVVLLIGAAIRSSISAYYYTNMGDALTGILCAVAVFLICYKGYGALDTISTNIAALGALGVAMFPCDMHKGIRVGIFHLLDSSSGIFHVIFAALFFLTLAFIAAFVFTKGKREPENTLYRVCGGIIAAMLICIVVVMQVYKGKPEPVLVFIFETVALWAFGVSWLVKGEVVKDARKVLELLGLQAAPAAARAGSKGR